jgi:hypothetical protein
MPLNDTIPWQPVPPPDVTRGGGGLAGLFSGFQSGWKVQGEQQERTKATGEKAEIGGTVRNLSEAFLRSRAEADAAADPFFAVKKKVAEQTQQMGALELNEAVRRRDERIMNEGLLQEFSGIIKTSLQDGTALNPESVISIQDFLGKHPSLLSDPRTKSHLTLFEAGRKLQEEASQRRKGLEAEQEARSLGMQWSLKIGEDGGVTREFEQPDSLEQTRIDVAKQNLQARFQEIELSKKRLDSQLPPLDREKLRAGLQAIATDPLIIKSDEKLKRMDDFIKTFQHQQGVRNAADPLGLFPQ